MPMIEIRDARGNRLAAADDLSDAIRQLVDLIKHYQRTAYGLCSDRPGTIVPAQAGENIRALIRRGIDVANDTKGTVYVEHNGVTLRLWDDSDPNEMFRAWRAQFRGNNLSVPDFCNGNPLPPES